MNLIIGNKSQAAAYFPERYERMSSRNIESVDIRKKYDSVYISFAEQRTFDQSLKETDFMEVNVEYTSRIIEMFQGRANRIVLFGTAELWNNCSGPISIETKIDYKYSPYIKSKDALWEKIRNKREHGSWQNAVIVHPFNFNSIHRREGFLFHKIFDSIINETIHEVGNINLDRDIIHPSFLIEKTLSCSEDMIVGSGKTTNIRCFISDIFEGFGMRMEDFIKERDMTSYHHGNRFWLESDIIYDRLLEDTLSELKKHKHEKH